MGVWGARSLGRGAGRAPRDWGDDKGSPDPFGAAEALRYITWLSIGYMIARGLAKSGSHENYDGS